MLFVTEAAFHGSLVRGQSGLPGCRGAGWAGLSFYFLTDSGLLGRVPLLLLGAAPPLIWEQPQEPL